jgi:hypothetical protein
VGTPIGEHTGLALRIAPDDEAFVERSHANWSG